MLRLRTSLVKNKPLLSLRHYQPSTSTWNRSSTKPTLADEPGNEQSPKSTTTLTSESSGIIDSDQSSPSSSSISTSTSNPTSTSASASTSTSTSSRSTSISPGNSEIEEAQKKSLDTLRETLLKWSNDRASQFRRKADDFTGATKARLSGLGAELNKVTGYEEIDALKRQVVEQDTEARIESTRQGARTAKIKHEEAVVRRSKSQREVNDLLHRKSSWTDEDVIRFTSLVREDHLFEQEEARAKLAVEEAENAVENEFTELMRSILARYHEEQVWSDKIRSASTYGQLAVLGLNMLVFILAIILVEPWKRKRLAHTFEKKVEELNEEYKEMLGGNMQILQKQLEDQAVIIAALTAAVAKVDIQTQRPVEEVAQDEDEPVSNSTGIWTKAVKDRNFGEAVAAGALAASVLSAIGWIWLGG
ncbi:sensitive to high expression protein 9 [Lentinula aciculospora]|uniref:Sensitive to high expression protein 9, mitochondrial n=1 Tax=Lentinula aciculospora TaxID=153920 RepID=A0A9W9DGY5_9AGAR|nr:sensitive to high expression protein 9 [Lentinula aciculospora]